MYYVDLLAKEYEDSIDSKRDYPKVFWVLTVFLIIAVVVFLIFMSGLNSDLLLLRLVPDPYHWVEIVTGMLTVICAFWVRYLASKTEMQQTETQLREGQMEEEQSRGTITITGGNVTTTMTEGNVTTTIAESNATTTITGGNVTTTITGGNVTATDRIAAVPPMESSIGTPMTNIGKREEVLQTFFQDHNLDTKDNAEIQELIDCIETRANKLERGKSLFIKFEKFFSAYIMPIAISMISIIVKELGSADLIVGGIGLIVTLFVWYVAISAIGKVLDEIFNKPTRQYHEMAQDIKLYNILRSDTPATSNESQT